MRGTIEIEKQSQIFHEAIRPNLVNKSKQLIYKYICHYMLIISVKFGCANFVLVVNHLNGIQLNASRLGHD